MRLFWQLHSQSIWSSRNSPSFQEFCLLCLSTLLVCIIQSRRVVLEIGFPAWWSICEKGTCGTSNSRQFWPLHQIGNCLIRLASAMNNGGCLTSWWDCSGICMARECNSLETALHSKECLLCLSTWFFFLIIYNTIMESRAGDSGAVSYMWKNVTLLWALTTPQRTLVH